MITMNLPGGRKKCQACRDRGFYVRRNYMVRNMLGLRGARSHRRCNNCRGFCSCCQGGK